MIDAKLGHLYSTHNNLNYPFSLCFELYPAPPSPSSGRVHHVPMDQNSCLFQRPNQIQQNLSTNFQVNINDSGWQIKHSIFVYFFPILELYFFFCTFKQKMPVVPFPPPAIFSLLSKETALTSTRDFTVFKLNTTHSLAKSYAGAAPHGTFPTGLTLTFPAP